MAKYEIVRVVLDGSDEAQGLPSGCDPFAVMVVPNGVAVFCKRDTHAPAERPSVAPGVTAPAAVKTEKVASGGAGAAKPGAKAAKPAAKKK